MIMSTASLFGTASVLGLYGVAAERKLWLRIGMVAQLLSTGFGAIIIVNMVGWHSTWSSYDAYLPGEAAVFAGWIIPRTRNSMVLAIASFCASMGLIAIQLKVRAGPNARAHLPT